MIEKKTPAQLKLQAKKALRGNYGICVGSLLLMGAILFFLCFAAEIPLLLGLTVFQTIQRNFQSILLSAIGMMAFVMAIGGLYFLMGMGYIRLCYQVCTGEKGKIGDLFFAFHSNCIGKFIGLAVLFAILPVLLGIPQCIVQVATAFTGHSPVFSVLFMAVSGMIETLVMLVLALNYGMSGLILVDDPQKSLLDALKESRRLMKGNKGRLFWLGLTFLGVVLLAYCSCGVGFLWLFPYMVCTSVFFYFDLTKIQEIKPEISDWDLGAGSPGWNPGSEETGESRTPGWNPVNRDQKSEEE